MSDTNVPEHPGFTEHMSVGFRDRGMGHGDLGVIDGEGRLLATVEAVATDGTFLPVADNVCLFAASPKLYAACWAALEALASDPRHAETLVPLLKEALAAAQTSDPG